MDPSQLQPGYRLDRYELLCPLAYGGMASVWLARFGGRLGFERLVVIKMILPQYSQDPRFQEMFLDEARIASLIEHANVARILDVGEHESSYFMVMEWVDGDSLSKILRTAEQRKQRIPTGIALRICADAAAGLHAAHELRGREDGQLMGVVHRDVSPQNILVANTGATMLIDFGVAKARDRVSQETSAGQLKGKVRYMAPEQAIGREIDRRADVWSLGAVLFEMLAGVPPYDGPNEIATLHKLTSGQKPAPLPPGIPSKVRTILDRALAFSAEHRYGTALEMNLALEAALVDIGEATSMAVVGHFTAQLLAERKAARKRAVDVALANARVRDGSGGQVAVPMTQPLPTVLAVANDDHGPRGAPQDPFLPPPPGSGNRVSRPSGYAPFGLAETPSATSQTLGSAALAFPPPGGEADDTRKKTFVAVALGVVMAAALIGTFLVVRSVMVGRDDEATTTKTNASGTAQVATSTTAVQTGPTSSPTALVPALPAKATVTAPPHDPPPATPAPVVPSATTVATTTTPGAGTTASSHGSSGSAGGSVAPRVVPVQPPRPQTPKPTTTPPPAPPPTSTAKWGF